MNVKERELLERNCYYFKQLWSWRKVAIEFDIYGTKAEKIDNSEVLMQCREDKITRLAEFLRVVDISGPCDIAITDPDKQQIVRVHKGMTFSSHKFDIFDNDDKPIGYFYRKIYLSNSPKQLNFINSEGSAQYILSHREDNFHSYSLSEGQKVHATITKDFGDGIKERLISSVKEKSADDYFVEISKGFSTDSMARRLALAAVVIVDYSFYTKK